MHPNNNGGSKFASQGQWTTGLYDCFDDPSVCTTTWCCPFITFGRNAEIIEKGNTSCVHAGLIFYVLGCFAHYYSRGFRTKLRALYSLPEEPCSDCCVHNFCLGCALCQEYRELKNRGIDPALGWAANAEKMKQTGQTAAPYVVPGMNR